MGFKSCILKFLDIDELITDLVKIKRFRPRTLILRKHMSQEQAGFLFKRLENAFQTKASEFLFFTPFYTG
jgi:hypothetical protein